VKLQYRIASLLLASTLLTACGDTLAPRIRPGTLPDTAPSTGGPPARTALIWYTVDPRVITLGSTDTVRITARVSGSAGIRATLRNGQTMTLRLNNTVYEGAFSVPSLLAQYRVGDHHHVGMQLIVDGESTSTSVSLNIKDAAIPSATVQAIDENAQVTNRVINFRNDSTSLGTVVAPALIRELYRHFFDDYDFIAIIDSRRAPRFRSYQGVRNAINGIGLVRYDLGPTYGSANRLQGLISYPNDDQFDLAETSNIHEIAHRWMNFTRGTDLEGGAPHWPLSDLAYGLMGRHDPPSNQGLDFPYRLGEASGGYRAERIERATEFNDLELYLMGLVSADAVRPHIVFQDRAQAVQANAVLQGPVDTVRITDIIAKNGARSPSSAGSQRSFRLATVILSRGRLLTRDEMSFFDYMAARGESENILLYSQGFNRGETKPFYLATGQRARLVTTIR
jgi:hypothetical protein